MWSVVLVGIIPPSYPSLHVLLWMVNTKKEPVPGSKARELSRKAEIKSVHRDISVTTKVQWHHQTRFLSTIASTKQSTCLGATHLFSISRHPLLLFWGGNWNHFPQPMWVSCRNSPLVNSISQNENWGLESSIATVWYHVDLGSVLPYHSVAWLLESFKSFWILLLTLLVSSSVQGHWVAQLQGPSFTLIAQGAKQWLVSETITKTYIILA